MSLAELRGGLEFEQTIFENQLLAEAREKLSMAVNGRYADKDLFEAVVPEYLNSLQKLWFERSPEARYESAQNLPRLIKMEMDLIFGPIEPIEDISDRIASYQSDEVSKAMLRQGISHYPRSATLVFLDMIDQYRR